MPQPPDLPVLPVALIRLMLASLSDLADGPDHSGARRRDEIAADLVRLARAIERYADLLDGLTGGDEP